MNVMVVIPWRSQPHRIQAFEYVWSWWESNFPEWPRIAVDVELDRPFCLAAARNRGISLAADMGADVVVVADADTFGDPVSIGEAVELADATDEWVIPYDEYLSLGGHGSMHVYAGLDPATAPAFTVPAAVSGIYVVTPKAWAITNGQDEQYVGWAPEDYSMLVAYRLLAGKEPRRVPGRCYALTHESATKEGPTYDSAVARYQLYLDAAERGDVAAMRALCGFTD